MWLQRQKEFSPAAALPSNNWLTDKSIANEKTWQLTTADHWREQRWTVRCTSQAESSSSIFPCCAWRAVNLKLLELLFTVTHLETFGFLRFCCPFGSLSSAFVFFLGYEVFFGMDAISPARLANTASGISPGFWIWFSGSEHPASYSGTGKNVALND